MLSNILDGEVEWILDRRNERQLFKVRKWYDDSSKWDGNHTIILQKLKDEMAECGTNINVANQNGKNKWRKGYESRMNKRQIVHK